MGYQVARFLYGSQNYGLSTPESDKDYKIIEFPLPEELFYKKELNRQLNENESVWDVRFFLNSLMRANPNALEFLFSVEQEYYSNSFKNLLDFIRLNVGSIIRTNWTGFSKALKGMAFDAIKRNGLTSKTAARCAYFFYLWLSVFETNGKIIEKAWKDVQAIKIRSIEDKKELEKIVENIRELWDDRKLELRENDEETCLRIENYVLNYFEEGLEW